MSFSDIFQQFTEGMRETTLPEYVAVLAGIGSTFLSKLENIWVYPTGILSTVIYIFISFSGGLYAEAGLNVYYTLMSFTGWIMWARKKTDGSQKLKISESNSRDWALSLLFFVVMWIVLYFLLKKFTPSTVPLADGFASATAYTAMLLMNRKKIESWYWWILTDLISMPLYFIKGYVFTTVQFLVFLLIAISGYYSWKKKHSLQLLLEE